MKFDKVRVLLNPRSRGVHRELILQLERQLDLLEDCSLLVPNSAQELAQQAARAVGEQVPLIVAAGGDGTINQVLQPIVGSPSVLGIIPLGRGNDIARGLRIPRRPMAAVSLLNHGEVRRIDIARAGDRYFAGVAGAGLDSTVNRLANRSGRRWPGWLVYPLCLLRALPDFRPPLFRTSWNGGGRSGRLMFAAVGNLRCYGGGMNICPHARPDDGLLDGCLVHSCSRWQLLQKFLLVYLGKHLNSSFVEYRRSSIFELDAQGEVYLYADGECFQRLPVILCCVPNALQVLVPGNPVGSGYR